MNDKKTKRIVAEVSSSYFWDIKKELANRKINVKDFLILMAAWLLNLDISAECIDEESQAEFRRMLKDKLNEGVRVDE